MAIAPAWSTVEVPGALRVSFIVPAYNAARTLSLCLAAIRAGAPPDSEVVVVDDASLDETASIARMEADKVVLRPCRGGAARCRNDGALASRGDALLFVDADVVTTPEAIAGILARLDEGAHAAFGAYQPLPPEGLRNVATTYKNLLHHHTHLTSTGEASTFWSGFGAVRRTAFFAVRGFDCAVTTGADVEDVHLGYRLRAAGFRIVVDPSLTVAHHKRYTVRQVIASDVFHRAVPWTKAMLELRTFRADLNLRRSAIVSALLADCMLVSLLAVPWWGWSAVAAAVVALGIWLLCCWSFLSLVGRVWGKGGILPSIGLLYLYFLYGQVGAVGGVVGYMFENGPRSMENKLRLVDVPGDDQRLPLTVAVTMKQGEPADALAAFPPPSSDWELLVAAEQQPPNLPAGARVLLAPSGSSRQTLRDLALAAAAGRMFASLNGSMVPDSGWLDRVRRAATTDKLAVGGSFHDDPRSARTRAFQLANFREWRTTRPAAWHSRHPLSNFVVRTDVARELGGFVDSELVPRLGGFGGFPVRFDPEMSVRLTGRPTLAWCLRHTGGAAWRQAAANRRYRDLRLSSALLLSMATPAAGLVWFARRLVGPVRDGSADRTWLASLPLVALLALSSVAGNVLGLLWPKARCAVGPRSFEAPVQVAAVASLTRPAQDDLPSGRSTI